MAADTHLLGRDADIEQENTDFPRQTETSILLVIRAAVKQEDSTTSYLRHVYIFFKNSSTFLLIRALMVVAAIAIFVTGLIRFRHCDLEPEIPLFLVLEGAAILLKSCIFVLRSCQGRAPEEGERTSLDTCTDVTSLFLVLWTLSGSVWVFGTYQRVNTYDPEGSDYCDKLVYTCALCFLVFIYMFVLIMVLLLTILSLYYIKRTHDNKTQTTPYKVFV